MRTYEKTHSWLTFFANLDRIPFNLWIMLGECQSKCEHIGDAPILPDTAKELYRLSLIKGAVATTAIEGNTLTEKEVKDYLDGNLRVSQSREYQVREVDNIIKACNDILDVIKSSSTPHLDVESIKTLNWPLKDQPARHIQVAAHALGIDQQAIHQRGGLVQQVVGQDGGIRQDHALHRGMRDVALVPQRDVFEGRLHVGAHHPRQAADLLAGHRDCACAAWRNCPSGRARNTPRPRAPRCAAGAALRARSSRTAPWPAPARPRSRRGGRAGSPARPPARACRFSRAQMRSSTSGPMCAKVPTAPEVLPTRRSSAAARKRARLRPASSYQMASFSPKVIGSACTPCVRPICTVCRNSSARRFSTARSSSRSAEQDGRRLLQQQRLRGIHHVVRRQAVVQPARGLGVPGARPWSRPPRW